MPLGGGGDGRIKKQRVQEAGIKRGRACVEHLLHLYGLSPMCGARDGCGSRLGFSGGGRVHISVYVPV